MPGEKRETQTSTPVFRTFGCCLVQFSNSLLNPLCLPDPVQDAKDTMTLKITSISVLNYGENGMQNESCTGAWSPAREEETPDGILLVT